MTHSSTRRRILRTVLGDLMLFGITAAGAGAPDTIAAAASVQGGVVEVPVIDKQDIRFRHISINNVAFQSLDMEDRAGSARVHVVWHYRQGCFSMTDMI